MKDTKMNAYAAQLQDMTRTDLYNLAKDANLPGRSKMTKDQLIEALTAAQAEVLAAQAPEVEEYYTEETTEAPRVKALITRDVPGAAFFNISNGVGGVIVREKGRFELVTGSGETITVRARTMVKAVKRLAVKLGIYLDAIDIVKVY
jgi:hypothetical protein